MSDVSSEDVSAEVESLESSTEEELEDLENDDEATSEDSDVPESSSDEQREDAPPVVVQQQQPKKVVAAPKKYVSSSSSSKSSSTTSEDEDEIKRKREMIRKNAAENRKKLLNLKNSQPPQRVTELPVTNASKYFTESDMEAYELIRNVIKKDYTNHPYPNSLAKACLERYKNGTTYPANMQAKIDKIISKM